MVNEYLLPGIEPMDWPAYSPDLNPIEELWDYPKRRIRNHLNPPRTLADLQQAVMAEWGTLRLQFINRYIQSMRQRCNDIIAARGGYTHY